MANPYGMTELDVPGALNALEAARSNRIRSMLLQRQLAREDAEAERQSGIQAALARYSMGGQSATNPTAAPAAAPALQPAPVVPGTIDPRTRPPVSNPDGTVSTVRSISIGTDQGEVLIPTVIDGRVVSEEEAIEHYRRTGEHLGIFHSPEEATAFARQLSDRQGQSLAEPDRRQQLFNSLLTIDPQTAFQMSQAFAQMDEAQFQAADRRRGVLARAAQYLLSIPEDRRSAEFQRIAPILIQEGGVTRQQLAGFELTPDNLNFVVAQARDVEQLAEEARPRLRAIGPGETLIDERRIGQGDPTVFESRFVEGADGVVYERVPAESLPQVSTPEDARRLPPGSRFRLPDGRIGTVPGGPTPSASDNFP